MSWVGWKLEGTSGRFCHKMPTDPFPPVLLQLLSAAPILGPSVQGPVLDSVAPATMATGPALSVGATAYCLGAVSLGVGLAAPVERPRPDWVVQVNLRMLQGRTWLWAHPQRKPCDKPTLNPRICPALVFSVFSSGKPFCSIHHQSVLAFLYYQHHLLLSSHPA